LDLAAGADSGLNSLPVFDGPFPNAANVEFLSQISPKELGAKPIPGISGRGLMNDIWGWTSPGGEEYALAPNSGGIAFVRVTDPRNPVFLGKIESQSPGDFANIWGDAATFGNYAYFVTEIVGSQIVIVDLSGLDSLAAADSPDSVVPAQTTLWSGGGYLASHNIFINESSGFAYIAGVSLGSPNACGNNEPPRFNTLVLDLNSDASNPTVAACLANAGEHDFYVVNYIGPDSDHTGKEIAFVFDGRDRTGAAIGGFTAIWDVSDKANIVELARFRTPGLVFSHNGWTTDQQDFLFIGDEIDELVAAGWSFSSFFAQPFEDPTKKPRTGTYIIDIRDLDAPSFFLRYEDETVGADSNLMVEGDKLYIASYTSGTRVINIARDAGSGDVVLTPFGRLDTEPRLGNSILNIALEEKFGTAFLGQWGIYAFPNSDTIIASDVGNGLIVMRLRSEPCQGPSCLE
jgi:choice-of-anchor B domain-containing protein